jgi:hypothetical protein
MITLYSSRILHKLLPTSSCLVFTDLKDMNDGLQGRDVMDPSTLTHKIEGSTISLHHHNQGHDTDMSAREYFYPLEIY